MADQYGMNDINDNEELTSPIGKLFQKIVIDSEFKKLLIENPDEALKDYDLNEAQVIMLKNLSEEDLNKLTPENLQEFFSADAAVYTPDESEMAEEEAYSVEDFLDIDEDLKKEDK
jgi:division protein CdvB (Snf7/Vps24/ESCRT-III family)